MASTLGNWDIEKFTLQTNIYYQFIYQTIFEMIDHVEKPLLTRTILQMEIKANS